MELKEQLKPIKGCLEFRVFDKNGVQTEWHRWDNLVTNDGYAAAAESLAGVAEAAISHIGMGTNDATPTVGDITLTDVFVVPVTEVSYPANGAVRFHFTVGFFDNVGMNIAEWGLITADGRLFSRLTRAVIIKTNEMMLKGSWTINI